MPYIHATKLHNETRGYLILHGIIVYSDAGTSIKGGHETRGMRIGGENTQTIKTDISNHLHSSDRFLRLTVAQITSKI